VTISEQVMTSGQQAQVRTNIGAGSAADVSANSTAIAKVQNGLAYIVGDTNTTGGTLEVGQFVYVKGHSTIAEGLRTVTASISADGNITTNNTSACSEGGLNALNSRSATFGIVEFTIPSTGNTKTLTLPDGFTTSNCFPVASAVLSDAWYWNQTANAFVYFAGGSAVFYYADSQRGRSAKVIFCKTSLVT
jgi:hypothetical protein